jgi:hypothetical protein
VDAFWLAVLALALMGAGLAFARRQWLALCLLPPSVVLAGLYAAIFSESRYRLPICMLLLPLSALALDWLVQTGRSLLVGDRNASSRWKHEAVVACGLTLLVFVASPLVALGGPHLRAQHRFAVHECRIAGQPRLCTWRTVGSSSGGSAVKGVWNGVGVALPAAQPPATIMAETELAAVPGNYTVHAEVDLTGARPSANEDATITLLADGERLSPSLALGRLPAAAREAPVPWQATLRHTGGPLRLRMLIEGAVSAPCRVWLSNLRLEPGGTN